MGRVIRGIRGIRFAWDWEGVLWEVGRGLSGSWERCEGKKVRWGGERCEAEGVWGGVCVRGCV